MSANTRTAGALSLTGPPPKFAREQISSVKELQSEIARRKKKRPTLEPVFRGYSATFGKDATGQSVLNPSDVYVTGLERVCQSAFDSRLDRAPLLEIAIIREFRRRAHHYRISLPESDHYFEWLALMQHHGAPTRLLDWTYSPYVAVHFALKHASRPKDALPEVWMIDIDWCLKASEAASKKAKAAVAGLRVRPITYKSEELASRELLNGNLPRSVWPLNPFRLNERLTIQKGVFLAPGDVTKSFSVNLAALPGHDSEANVTCFTIPRSEIPQISRDLYDASITGATLFPGLDGFAKSLFMTARHLQLDKLTWASL